jgi:hypothetical protein
VDQSEATQRILAKVTLPVGTPAPVGFLLEIVVASVLSWIIQRCLSRLWPALAQNPGVIGAWRLNRAIRRACDEAASDPSADALHLDGADLYSTHGAAIREAILAVGREATPGEWVAFRAGIPKPMKPF